MLAAAAVPICLGIAHANPQRSILAFAFYSEFIGEKFRAVCKEAGVNFEEDFARTRRVRSALVDIAMTSLDPAAAETLLTAARSEGEGRADQVSLEYAELAQKALPAQRKELERIICMTEVHMQVRQLADVALSVGGAENLFRSVPKKGASGGPDRPQDGQKLKP